MKKILLTAVIGLFLSGCEQEIAQTEAEQGAEQEAVTSAFSGRVDAEFQPLEKKKKEEKSRKTQHCGGKPVVIEMDGVEMTMERTSSLDVSFRDGETIERLDKKCHIEKLSDVVTIRSRKISLSKNDLETYYAKQNINQVKEKFASHTPQILENGTKKYVISGRHYYIFPIDKASAYGGDPVIAVCGAADAGRRIAITDRCVIRMRHSNGLYLSHWFFRGKLTEDEYLDIHLKKISLFEKITSEKK